jgi:hypothetical protein
MGTYTTQPLYHAGITFSGLGTITIRGKSYDIPSTESLCIGKTKKFERLQVWQWWFYAGFGGVLIASINLHLWLAATIISLIAAGIFLNLKEYALFCEMEDGQVCIYSDLNLGKVEAVRKDIIKMSDPSCIADMQVGWERRSN